MPWPLRFLFMLGASTLFLAVVVLGIREANRPTPDYAAKRAESVQDKLPPGCKYSVIDVPGVPTLHVVQCDARAVTSTQHRVGSKNRRDVPVIVIE